MAGGEGMDEDDPAIKIENMYYNRCAPGAVCRWERGTGGKRVLVRRPA
jgi:hypothetical protein